MTQRPPLAPNSTIGILGGGQLGRMLGMAAARLGYRIAVLEPDPKCPAAQIANTMFGNAYDDENALIEFAEICDVITLEFENVPVSTVERLNKTTPVNPNADALRIAQDRFLEKSFLDDSGAHVAPYFDISSAEQLHEALAQFAGRGILKTRRLGYDGHGQAWIKNEGDDLTKAKELIESSNATGGCILEKIIPFKREISVIVARNALGQIVSYDPAENVHKNAILYSSTLPANSAETTQANAKQVAANIVEKLGYIGVMGVEFFELEDGSLLVNEVAPRVHNSGHWTEAACAVSQFEMHIRCITGLPLPPTTRHCECQMQNILGEDLADLEAYQAEENAVLHLYGKREARNGRKMGHITRLK